MGGPIAVAQAISLAAITLSPPWLQSLQVAGRPVLGGRCSCWSRPVGSRDGCGTPRNSTQQRQSTLHRPEISNPSPDMQGSPEQLWQAAELSEAEHWTPRTADYQNLHAEEPLIQPCCMGSPEELRHAADISEAEAVDASKVEPVVSYAHEAAA